VAEKPIYERFRKISTCWPTQLLHNLQRKCQFSVLHACMHACMHTRMHAPFIFPKETHQIDEKALEMSVSCSHLLQNTLN
jgi:hypothetical protein